jgi:hypothetical protein
MAGTPFYALAYTRINGEFKWIASSFHEFWFVHIEAQDLNFEI